MSINLKDHITDVAFSNEAGEAIKNNTHIDDMRVYAYIRDNSLLDNSTKLYGPLLRGIAGNKTIRHLTLTNIRSLSMRSFEFAHLRELYIHDCKICDDGAKYMCQSVANNSNIIDLVLFKIKCSEEAM